MLPITTVDPHACKTSRHHKSARRPVKAGQPLPHLPMFGHVLGQMRVRRQDDTRIKLPLKHGASKAVNTVIGGLRAYGTIWHSIQANAETSTVAPVLAWTSSTLTSGASSSSLKPLSVTSMTAKSVTISLTTPSAVKGSEHSDNSLMSSVPSFRRAT